jgi:hypothetical protein
MGCDNMNSKDIMLDLLRQAETKLLELLHNIENDSSVPDDAWMSIDHESGEVFHLIEKLRDELLGIL